jgi:hypothetical protein
MGFLGLLAASIALLWSAELLLRLLRPRAADGDGPLLLVLFTLLQSLAMLAAGTLGLLRPLPLGLSGTALLAALFAARSWPDWNRWRPPPATDRGELWSRRAVAAGAAVLVAKSVFLSPYGWDATTYHLPKIASWIQSGRFHWPVGPESRQWFPAGFELVELWWTALPAHDLLVEFGGLQLLLLAVASLRTLARRLGAHPGLAALVFFFLPLVQLHATFCGNDLAVAAYLLAGLALSALRVPWPLQALPFLLAAGTKPTFLFALPCLILFALRSGSPQGFPSPRLAVPLLAAGVLLAVFWYGRNAAIHGHPFYPVYSASGPIEHSHRFDPLENLDTLRRTLEEFPRRMVDPRPFTAFATGATAWGWFCLPFGVPLALLSLRDHPAFRRLALAFVAGAFSVVALSPLNDLNLRFVLWFPALFALAAGLHPGRLAWTGAALAALLSVLSTLVPLDSMPTRDSILPSALPADAPVACLGTDESPVYPLYGPRFTRRVVYPATMHELRASGVRYAALWTGWRDAELLRKSWKPLGGPWYEAP